MGPLVFGYMDCININIILWNKNLYRDLVGQKWCILLVHNYVISIAWWIYLIALLLSHDVEFNPGPLNHKKLKCVLINARSLKVVKKNYSKMSQFNSVLEIARPHLVAVTETWLNNDVNDCEFLKGYQIFRRDRNDGKIGGGILLLAHNDINIMRRADLEVTSSIENEIIICEMKANNVNYFIVLGYRPPSASMAFNRNFELVLNNIYRNGGINILILGDFNMPNVDWPNLSSSNSIYSNFLNVISEFDLQQYNHIPSRARCNNILEVVCCNMEDFVSNINVDDTNGLLDTDHVILGFNLNIDTYMIKTNTSRKIFNFKNCDFESLSSKFNCLDILPFTDIDSYWNLWLSEVKEIVNKNVPKIKIRTDSQAWVNSHFIKLMKKKNKQHKKAKEFNTDREWEKFRRLRNKVKRMSNKLKKDYWEDHVDNVITNPKRFWSDVKSKGRDRIPHCVQLDDVMSSDDRMKAELFNRFFFSVFNKNKPADARPNFEHHIFGLDKFSVHEIDVRKGLKDLNINKACGHDLIPNIVLKNCADILAKSLTFLFNKILELGIIPSDWKRANVVPIFKSGCKNNIRNYRPVSLLPVVSKILERLVHSYLFSKLKHLITCKQYGFMPKKSTSIQLIESYEEIGKSLDKGSQVDAIFLDFAKAFDTVDHMLLITKLKFYGVKGTFLKWFESYLGNRQQRVVINGKSSDYVDVMSGVPQGSILGPLLFILYINDIVDCLDDDTKIYLFADDAKMFREINNVNDCVLLQQQLNGVHEWSLKWNLKFNSKKCKVLAFSYKRVKIAYKYRLCGDELEHVNSIRDLGVIVSNKLTWNEQVDSVVKKANKMLWLLKRKVTANVFKAKLLYFNSLVRPHLEYCSNVWQTSNKTLNLKLESVYRQGTLFICNYDRSLTYIDRLKKCSLTPLCFRFEFNDLMLLYKGIHNKCDLNILKFCTLDTGHRTRSSDKRWYWVIPRCHTENYKKSFFNRTLSTWNKLPAVINNLEYGPYGTLFKKKLLDVIGIKFEVFNINQSCTWKIFCNCNRCNT